MRNLALILPFLVFLMLSCHRKVVDHASGLTENSKVNEENKLVPEERPAPENSWIIGKIVEVFPAGDDSEISPCDEHPCHARVEVVEITNRGMNYHGQYESGDILTVHFIFTLSSTESIFPELNEHLPGLSVGRLFKAELFEKPGEGQIIIKSYQVIE